MTIQETVYFLRQLSRSFTSIGALIPTSRYAARVMASEFSRRRGPRAVLEVGAGTGAITAEIVRAMRPGDELVVYELNDEFAAYLERRFAQEPAFQRVRGQVRLVHGDITEIDRSRRFDAIISAIPFNNLPPELVESILACYRAILKPGGVLTYIEYAYLRVLKSRFQSSATRAQIAAVSAVLDGYLGHQFRRDFEPRNLPPAWVRHLRFDDPAPAAALELDPLDQLHRLALGPRWGLATAALPWLAGLLAALALAPLRRVRWPLALTALAVAAFFRDPTRQLRPDPTLVYAAADGRVTAVERLHDERLGPQEWLRIVVFLSLTDVHINRSPVAGKVRATFRAAGGFAAANRAAAEQNQALFTVIDGVRGPCVVAQRVGLVARRIVSWAAPGQLLAQGERFGLIQFGSRTDVYLPADSVTATVAVGNRVVGGETVIARFG